MNSFTTAEKTAYRFGFAMGHLCEWIDNYNSIEGKVSFNCFIAEVNEYFNNFTDDMIEEILNLYDEELTKFNMLDYDILSPNRKSKTIYIFGDIDIDDCIGMVLYDPEECDTLINIPKEEWNNIIDRYYELNVLECECCGDQDHKNKDGEWTFVLTREGDRCLCNNCYKKEDDLIVQCHIIRAKEEDC